MLLLLRPSSNVLLRWVLSTFLGSHQRALELASKASIFRSLFPKTKATGPLSRLSPLRTTIRKYVGCTSMNSLGHKTPPVTAGKERDREGSSTPPTERRRVRAAKEKGTWPNMITMLNMRGRRQALGKGICNHQMSTERHKLEYLQKQKNQPKAYTPTVLPTIRGCLEGLAVTLALMV